MRELPLAVLAFEGPRVRAYLEAMRRLGLRPRKIVVPLFRKGTGRPYRSRWFNALRARTQFYRANYWPLRIRQRHPELYAAVVPALETALGLGAGFMDEALAAAPYSRFAGEVEYLGLGSYGDEGFGELLDEVVGELPTLLYCGGEIVPKAVLERVRSRFLHVHPGALPWVRGADGLLWSVLMRGRPGVSSFYLVPEIDEGEVVASEELGPLRFDISAAGAVDDPLLYNLLFSYCDPLIRAAHLGRVLEQARERGGLAATPQVTSQGETYRFMHPALRRRVLRRIFVTGPVTGRG